MKKTAAEEDAPAPPRPSSSVRDNQRPSSGTEKEGKQYDIDIFEAWCKSCGICVSFCPRECLALDDEGVPQVKTPERCTGCGWCEIHCPDFAISIRERQKS